MSNLTRLQAVSSSLDTAIATAENLPEAGGGGGSIETCTVTISFTYGDPYDVWISGTQLIDGNITPFTFIDYAGGGPQFFASPLTISNIVKNTPLTISGYGRYRTGSSTLTGCELLYTAIGPETIAIKVTDTTASAIITNAY